jgi:hypothetical protein
MNQHHLILGIHLTDRLVEASDVQAILTEFGPNIMTRLGLHDADGNVCGVGGVILLELVGGVESFDKLAARLEEIPGVEVHKMVFAHWD